MGYFLYLRRRESADALEAPALESVLERSGAVRRDGAWSLTAEQGRVDIKLAGAPGPLEGLDWEIPYGGPEGDYRAALLAAAATAAQAQLTLLDPQLGREVGPTNAEDSVARWRESNRYALDTAGLSEDPRRDLPMEPHTTPVKPWVKFVGLGIAGLVVALTLLNWLVGSLSGAPKPID
jgi:hypothetical protein